MLCIPRAALLLVGISLNPGSPNKRQLLAFLPFVPAVSWHLKPQFGRVSVIPVLFRFLISSVAHAGK